MFPRRITSLMAALAVALPGPALIPQERPREGQAPAFGTTTAVVTLDLVVRDKKGRPVRDLKPGEIEVFEDDARCPVRSFRLVEGESGVEAGAPSAAPAPEAPAPAAAVADPAHVPTLVTLVFDRFDAEGAKLARKAALDFVARGSGPRTRIAVFRIASGLALLAPYSADAETLNAAIGRATDLTDLRGSSLTKEAQKRQSEYQALVGQTTAPSPATGSVAEATSTFAGGGGRRRDPHERRSVRGDGHRARRGPGAADGGQPPAPAGGRAVALPAAGPLQGSRAPARPQDRPLLLDGPHGAREPWTSSSAPRSARPTART